MFLHLANFVNDTVVVVARVLYSPLEGLVRVCNYAALDSLLSLAVYKPVTDRVLRAAYSGARGELRVARGARTRRRTSLPPPPLTPP